MAHRPPVATHLRWQANCRRLVACRPKTSSFPLPSLLLRQLKRSCHIWPISNLIMSAIRCSAVLQGSAAFGLRTKAAHVLGSRTMQSARNSGHKNACRTPSVLWLDHRQLGGLVLDNQSCPVPNFESTVLASSLRTKPRSQTTDSRNASWLTDKSLSTRHSKPGFSVEKRISPYQTLSSIIMEGKAT